MKTMTATHTIGISSTIQREPAIETIMAGFSADPIARWVWPDDAAFRRFFPPFVEAFAGGAFATGSAYVAEDFGGVALWLPPGVGPDEDALATIAMESIEPDRQEEVFALLQLQSELHPTEAHWYLPLIGVDPGQQGQGLGSTLIEHTLRIVDDQSLPAYLEATSQRNMRLYERHGFRATGVIQHGSSPPMWTMYRVAR